MPNLLMEREGVPIGRLCWEWMPDELRLVDISLLPAWRGQGLGQQVVSALQALAAGEGLAMGLHVEVGNRAIALYERLGFVMHGARRAAPTACAGKRRLPCQAVNSSLAAQVGDALWGFFSPQSDREAIEFPRRHRASRQRIPGGAVRPPILVQIQPIREITYETTRFLARCEQLRSITPRRAGPCVTGKRWPSRKTAPCSPCSEPRSEAMA